VGDGLAELARGRSSVRHQHRAGDAGLVAYAAAEAEVLPVEAHTTALAPAATAAVIAMVIPRSLKEPVGFIPSTFRYTSEPVSSESARARTSGRAAPRRG
jgi:hypothetical protein